MIDIIKGLTISMLAFGLLSGCDSSSSSSTSSTTSANTDCEVRERGPLGENEEAATIPDSIATTYQVTFSESTPGSGIEDGTTSEFLVGTDGTLTVNAGSEDCVTLVDPVLYSGNPYEAIWFDDTDELQYALSDVEGNFNEINVGSNVHYDQQGFVFYGQFSNK